MLFAYLRTGNRNFWGWDLTNIKKIPEILRRKKENEGFYQSDIPFILLKGSWLVNARAYFVYFFFESLI